MSDSTLQGTPGHDLIVGTSSDNLIIGGAGNDTLTGAGGADTYLFRRGDGADVINAQAFPRDTLQFGPGILLTDVEVLRDGDDLVLTLTGSSDTVRIAQYFLLADPDRVLVRFDGGSAWDAAEIQRKIMSSNDHLSAAPSGQLLDGGLGNDTLNGGQGADSLYGDAGNDLLSGGVGGNDTYYFGRSDGQDTLAGAVNSGSVDTLQLGYGITVADVDVSKGGTDGNDLVLSLRGSKDTVLIDNYFNGPPSNPPLIRFADGGIWDRAAIERKFNVNSDFLSLPIQGGGVLLDGGGGNDSLSGSDGDDSLYGDTGSDTLNGGMKGSDTYYFGRGDGQDLIVNSTTSSDFEPAAFDTLRLGAGITLADVEVRRDASDLVLNLRNSSDSVTLANYFSSIPSDRSASIVFADGAVLDRAAVERKLYPTNDSLVSPPMPATGRTLDGGLGNDTLTGGDGDDIVYGDTGNDTTDGGLGSNLFLFGRGDGQDTVFGAPPPSSTPTRNTLKLGADITAADVDVSVENNDLILSLQGSSDSLRITGYFFQAPPDRVAIVFADGMAWNSQAIERKLTRSDDSLLGDPQTGTALDGGLGNDTLTGGLGFDRLYGDSGNDLMDGGPGGGDTYYFGRGDGQDTITGASSSYFGDVLQLGQGITVADVDVSSSGSNLILSLKGSSDSVRILGYLSVAQAAAPLIRFADGGVWDRAAIERKFNTNSDFLSLPIQGGGVLLDGGGGNDSLSGSDGDDSLYGDTGSDTLNGGMKGSDTYYFGRGDGQDLIVNSTTSSNFEPAAFDTLRLGAGIALTDVDVRREAGDLILSLRNGSDSVTLANYFSSIPSDRSASIVFADGAVLDRAAVERKLAYTNDSLVSPPMPAVGTTLDGGLGNDTLIGGDGDDIVYGDSGNDSMDGGRGSNLFLFGRGDGQDTLFGAPPPSSTPTRNTLKLGADISVADVDVSVEGGDLILSLQGSSDSVRITGYFFQAPADRVAIVFADGMAWNSQSVERKLARTDDQLMGDPLTGTALDGGLGNDTLYGGQGADRLYGDSGNDAMDGGLGGGDTYYFGRGDGRDTLTGATDSTTVDTLQLGAGISVADVDVRNDNNDLVLSLQGSSDTVRIAGYFNAPASNAPLIRFADGGVWDRPAVDRKFNFNSDFVFLPSGGGVLVDGGGGDDSLSGNDGDDSLYGDGGRDTLNGGVKGSDTYYFGRGDGQDIIVNSTTSSNFEPAAFDTLRLGAGIALTDVVVRREAGDLILSLRNTSDSVTLANYFSSIPSDRSASIVFADGAVLDRTAVERKLNPSNDSLVSAPMPAVGTTLDGGLGNDTLTGGDGDDILYGDTGNDSMDGGRGSNLFLFGRGDGQDTVFGAPPPSSTPTRNTLKLGTDISVADVDVRSDGNDLILSLQGSSDSVRITGYFFQAPADRVAIVFADGMSWNSQAVQRKLFSSHDQLSADPLTGTILDGGLGNDTLNGGQGADRIYGDAGNDQLNGGPGGGDTFYFGRGDGQDTLSGTTDSTSVDTLQLGYGITPADVDVRNDNNDLVLSLRGSSDTVRILGYFNAPASNAPLIRFAEGGIWDRPAVDRKFNTNSDFLSLSFPSRMLLDGGGGNDSLSGSNGDDSLYGDTGRDTLNGGVHGNDVYYFGRGDGQDLIVNSTSNTGLEPAAFDTLRLGTGIALTDVDVRRDADDLTLTLHGGSDSVTLANYFSSVVSDRSASIVFADGAVLDRAAVARKLNPSSDSLVSPPMPAVGTTLDGGLGNDTLIGGDGDDILYGDGGNDTMDGGRGSNLFLFGRGDGQDTLFGAPPPSSTPTRNTLKFGADISVTDVDVSVDNNDLILSLQGSTDSVRITGYFFQAPADRVAIVFADGMTWNSQTIERKLVSSNDQVWDDPLIGSMLDGGLGNDTLNGGQGADRLYGDSGNDQLNGGPGGGDIYYFGRGDGQDTIFGAADSTSVDSLQLGAGITVADIEALRNGFDLVLLMQSSSDTVRIADYFNAPASNAPLIRFADGGVWDRPAVDRKFNVNPDILSTSIQGGVLLDGGGGNDSLSGSDGDDSLYGDTGRDTLNGGMRGSDTYYFGRGDGQDLIVNSTSSNLEPAAFDTLRLGAGIARGDVEVRRNAGDLTLTLRGGSDSVTLTNYFSGIASDRSASIVFADGAVWDRAEIDRRLASVNDYIDGTPGNDLLEGFGGNDTLYGHAGNDTLRGGDGVDLLRGDEGADLLEGGDGDDTYEVDASDTVIEAAGAGNDMVHSDVSYTLPGNVEYLALTGTAAIDATGNNLHNRLFGNAGNNVLDGKAGNDSMWGGQGDDTYVVDNLNDFVGEDAGNGIDTVLSSVARTLGDNVENLTLTGPGSGLSPNVLAGNALNNRIAGNIGTDYLDGRGGDDQMLGGAGDDTYIVEQTGDQVIENLDEGTDTVKSGLSYVLGANVETLILNDVGAIDGTGNDGRNTLIGNSSANVLRGEGGDDWIYGNAGDDSLYGGDGNDQLEGGAGVDLLVGGLGNDYYLFDNADTIVEEVAGGTDTMYSSTTSVVLAANIENVALAGTAFLDGTGNELDNTLSGNSGNNVLDGRGGADLMQGLIGDDTYIVDQAGDRVVEAFYEGVDTVRSSISYVLDANVENLTLTGTDAITATGNSTVNLLIGNAAANLLDGGGDGDDMRGGDGDDTYIVESGNDLVSELAGQGNDTVISDRANFSLTANVENLILRNLAALNGTGNAQDNRLTGNGANNNLQGGAGNDTLDGGAGNDMLDGGTGDDQASGGAGNDSYFVDSAGDGVFELSGEGNDIVFSALGSYTLGDHVEQLVLRGTAVEGIGNALVNQMSGNASGNRLDGAGGNDSLYGMAGNDTLIGGAGADLMVGGVGDDTYSVDQSGDQAFESVGEGTDTVESSVSHVLGFNVENLRLGGAAAIDATGNELANVLVGNAASNRIDGGAGADTMAGGAGGDTYVVDNEGDVIVELAGEGVDTVISRVGINLADNVENVVLDGNYWQANYAKGNALDNRITGSTLSDVLHGEDGNDTLDGGIGSIDTLLGGAGDDTYIVDTLTDTIVENADAGTDTVVSSVSYSLDHSDYPQHSLNIENVVLVGNATNATGNSSANTLTGNALANELHGGDGHDALYGGDGNDTLYGDSGNDTLYGGSGADLLIGGASGDLYVVDEFDIVAENSTGGDDTVQADFSYTLTANVETLVLTGAAAINGTGTSLANLIVGNAADNVLDGAGGSDEMRGGAGNDTYYVDQGADRLVEAAGEGTDSVFSSTAYTLGDNVENLTLTGSAILATGNGSANRLAGNTLDNTIDGGAGNDTMLGGIGWDTYVVDSTGDQVIELAGEGVDTVMSSVSYTLGTNLENLALTGTAAIDGTGNAASNRLVGNAAANVLDGGSGSDTMEGGAGDDVYHVDSAGDVVTELAGEGTDTVQLNVEIANYTLAGEVENLRLGGSALNAIGNALANRIDGTAGNNQLQGGAGNDTLIGAAGTDSLIGGTGNDSLDGGAGRDTMVGGEGDDTYVVDSTTDVVTEVSGQGIDTVQSGVNWTVGTAQENLTLTGSATLTGSGNAGDNVLIGNAGNNALNGLAGADWLDGGAGADTMTGGSGSDTYVVDNVGDRVVEVAGGGSDTVRSSIGYTLGTSQEDLTLIGSADIDGTGNEQENTLIGNGGNNVLDGGADNDVMQGGLGNDTYLVDHASDLVVEAAGEGIDSVVSTVNFALAANVENLTAGGTGNRSLTGNALDNVLTGNTGDNTLNGLAGNDTLVGGAGKDSLNGGAGDDVLIGGTGSDTYGFERGGGIDRVQENDTASAPRDRVVFGTGILQADVSFQQSGNDLWATLNGSADRLVVDNWYLGTRYRVEEFQFGDGSVISAAQAQGLVSAMAAFSAPAAGSTSVASPNRSTQIDLAVGSTL